MKTIHIFIETSISQNKKNAGIYTNEYHFIEDYLHHISPDINKEDYTITDVGGKDKLKFYANFMQQNSKLGEPNLVIFDCDDISKDGGIKERTQELLSLKEKLNIDFHLFLFPNNQEDGAFEELLLKIVNPKHHCLLDCFEGYEKCIGGHDPEDKVYQRPNTKAKIYSYISTFKRSRSQNERLKQGDWDFLNSEYWNLNSEYLNPLKEFLEKFTI